TSCRASFFAELGRFPGLAGRFDPKRLVREVLTTGPFARWSRRSVADGGGALLVGDAADFFDPFTGQGIYSALAGAELAAACLLPALARGVSEPIPAANLQPYTRAPRRAPPRGRPPPRARARGQWAHPRRELAAVHPRAAARVRREVALRAADRARRGVAGAHQPRRGRAGAPARPRGSCGGGGRKYRPGASRLSSGRPGPTAPMTTHGVDPAQFRHLVVQFATGVTVLTARDARGHPIGMTASSVASVSLRPPLLLVCVDQQHDMH